jgi:ABC-type nitrate/sulfonate/bicarbonate transport system permease component
MSAATPEETYPSPTMAGGTGMSDMTRQAPPVRAAPEAGGAALPAARKRRPRIGSTTLISIASVIVVLAAWQLCASAGVVDQKLTSSPWGVVQAARFLIDNGQLGGDVASSASLFGVGLGLAIAIGAIGGVLIGWWRLVAAVFEPWIAILYSMPLIALLPLILVWFGISFKAEVVMVVLISVFPVLVSVITGTRNVDPELVKLARSFCGSEAAVIRTVLVPSLVPYFVSGVRLAIGSGLVGVVVSEYFLGNSGIGGLIVTAGENLQSGEVFVGITILALSAIVMTGLLRRAEQHISRWRSG